MLRILLLMICQTGALDWAKNHQALHRTSYKNSHELRSDGFLNWDEEIGLSEKQEEGFFSEFRGNSSHIDHFKLLKEDGSSVLVGARNVIYNLSLPNLVEFREERIDWTCSLKDKTNCDLKGKSEPECQNYIRVLSVIGPDLLLVCGTNCYSPLCRHYHYTDGQYRVKREFSGRGYAPYDPTHNSTSLYTSGHLYAATVADFSGTDSLIIKDSLRTEQYDYKHLNAPDFVSSLEDEEHVYFFFREAAVEFMNCGKSIYSRVARVCKQDEGGSHKFRNRWTTFLKSRLNCSVPGDYPFYFNEIQSTTGFFRDDTDNRIFYGVFTTPGNSILGSAICRFSVDDMEHSFEGNFKNQESLTSNWLPMSTNQVPTPRPGRCYNQTSSLPESSLHFIKNHCLMDAPVTTRPSGPVFVRTGSGELFTKIALHKAVNDLSENLFDVLFIGTNRGAVMKVIVDSARPSMDSSVLLEELQIFPSSVPILNLLIVNSDSREPKLIVLSADSVKSIPLASCRAQNCSSCLENSDPYCAWDLAAAACLPHSQVEDKSWLVQSEEQCPVPPEIIETTIPPPVIEETTIEVKKLEEDTVIPVILSSSSTPPPAESSTTSVPPMDCPDCSCSCPSPLPLPPPSPSSLPQHQPENLTSSIVYQEISQSHEEKLIEEKEAYTLLEDTGGGEVLAPLTSNVGVSVLMDRDQVVMITVATGITSLVIGFVIGFFLSKIICTGKSSRASVTSSTAHLMKPCPIEKPLTVDSGYATPTLPSENNNKNINLMMNSAKSGKTERAKMSCTGTLQKVKRVYL